MKETTIDLLKSLQLFDMLDKKELSTISDYMEPIDIEKDAILFKEGEKGDYVCFIANGEIEIIKKSSPKYNALLATLYRGDLLGEMSFIDDAPRSATVKAKTHARLIKLSKDGFNLILEDHPRIGNKILKKFLILLSRHMRVTSTQLSENMVLVSKILSKKNKPPKDSIY